MRETADRFQLDGLPIYCERFGNGHINESYLLIDATAREYILQKINRRVFHDPEALMANVVAVTEHLGFHAVPREVMILVPTKDGHHWYRDEQGDYWRLYEFISDSLCLQKPETPADFRESGAAFGRFQEKLSDFPAAQLHETIPRFHDTPNRYQLFKEALASDLHGRAKEAEREIQIVLAREAYAATLVNLQACGELPLRVTHNDTKLNNVLFDRRTRKALCVIDLDTVMPGLSVNDYGDSIRFGASTGAEDERDLDKISLSLSLFETYTDGYLSTCGTSLTACEIAHLCDGAKMMTLECGVRFLTDYLAGDVYFRTSRETHNLDRCRTQFKLVAEMEQQWDQMQSIVRACYDRSVGNLR